MDVKMIVLGIVLILVTITLLRYIFASYSKLDGLKNANSVTKVSPSSISTTNSNNYAYSAWMYVEDWSYRYGEPKIVLGRLDEQMEPSPSIQLGAIENNLKVSVACYPTSENDKFTIHNCTVDNIPLQKWVNVIVSLYNRTLDVYLDGKLVRTCVLPGVAKISNDAPIYITPLGGFSGYTSNVQYYPNSLNPQQAYNIYRAGSGTTEFPYSIKVSFLENQKEQGSVQI